MANTNYKKLEFEDPQITPLVGDSSQHSKKGSCFMKVCCTLFVGVLGVSIVAGASMYILGRKIVRKVSVTTPTNLPVVDIPIAKVDQVKDRAMLFIDTIRAGEVPTEDFVVTEEEINGVFGHSEYLRGNLYLSLSDENNEIKTEFSLPTEYLPGGSGRFFVGSDIIDIDHKDHQIMFDLDVAAFDENSRGTPLVLAVFKYAMNRFESKHFDLFLQSMKIFGENKAEEFIEKHENLLEDLYSDPRVSQVLEQIESITIENSSIIVKPRRGDTLALQLQHISDTEPELIQEIQYIDDTEPELLQEMMRTSFLRKPNQVP